MPRHPKTVRGILNKAADLIEERGWCRQGGGRAPGPLGAYNAIMVAAGWSDKASAALNALRSLLGVDWVSDWNSTIARDKRQVIRVLRKAAKEA